MKVIKCWELQSGGWIQAYVATREAADEWKKLNTSSRIQEREFVIFDDLKELEDYNNKTLREQELAKLSPEERKALGL